MELCLHIVAHAVLDVRNPCKMLLFKRLATITTLVVAILLLAPELEARTRKGEKLLKQGEIAEAKKDFDTALELYEQAVAEDPQDAAYKMAAYRARFQASQQHYSRGRKLLEDGNLEEAAAAFQRAYAVDPSSTLATDELRKTLRLIEQRKKAPEGEETPPKTPTEEAQEKVDKLIESIQAAPELKPINRRVSSLKMNNQPMPVLFETLGKIAGVNVLFDPEMQAPTRRFTIDLANVSLEQALEHLSVLTKMFWKPLSQNTIFITNENPTKRRDYEDFVVRVFYIRNVTTPQELQEIGNVLRSLADIRRVFPYPSQNAILVRGTVDQVRLAEKLVRDMDKPRGEIVVDVIVLSANRSRTRDLAATFVSGGTNGLALPITFSPRSSLQVIGQPAQSDDNGNGDTPAQTPAVRLSNLANIGTRDFVVTLPNIFLQALMSDRDTRVLQSPQIRTADGAKSSLKIGDRFPYATGSFQPGVGAVGVSPLVSTQFQFADVGVNVDITPKVHGSDEVSMQVDIDISSVRDNIDIGGLSQPIIGQSKLSHAVRLREGEVTLLGGLIQDTDSRTRSGTAGLASIPLLRHLFSGQGVSRTQSELLIALIPHIVRYTEITADNTKAVAAGSDTVVKLMYASPEEEEPTAPAPPAEAKPAEEPKPLTPAKPAIPVPGMPGAAPAKPVEGVPTTPPPPPAEPVPEQPKPEAAPPKETAAPPEAPGQARVVFLPGSATVQPNGTVVATLQLEGGTDVFSVPIQIRWDPKILRLNDVARGGMFAAGGQQPIFTRNVRNEDGEATVLLNRLPGTQGVSGSGALVVLRFQAVAAGETQVTVPEITLRNSQMQAAPVAAPVMKITVQ